jgi:hypothetical protein
MPGAPDVRVLSAKDDGRKSEGGLERHTVLYRLLVEERYLPRPFQPAAHRTRYEQARIQYVPKNRMGYCPPTLQGVPMPVVVPDCLTTQSADNFVLRYELPGINGFTVLRNNIHTIPFDSSVFAVK